MVSKTYVDDQLSDLGLSFRLWSKSAINELPKILVKGEKILGVVNGRYDRGFATLCATDRRVLLIDKKPLFLNLNDIRYDTVAEIDYNYRLIDAYLVVRTFGQTVRFRSWSQKQLRDMSYLIQGKVLDLQSNPKDMKEKASVRKVITQAAQDIEKKIQSFAPQQEVKTVDILDKPSSRRVEFIQQAASRANKIGKFALD